MSPISPTGPTGPSPFDPPRGAVVDVVARALAEDLTPLGDLTSALLPPGARAEVDVVAREAGVLAGTACAIEAFGQVDPGIEVDWPAADGDRLVPGVAFASLRGSLATILTAERTALNLLGHLSGVATLTARYADALRQAGSPTRIWDTRKTTPGLRALEKAAVRAGGGANHRGNLSDWVLLKDNHLTGTGIAEAVALARRTWPGRTVHVECDRLDQVVEALDAGADALLLDNMSPDEVRSCVAAADDRAVGGRRPLLEASGGIDLATIEGYAHLGLDCISVGRITNSAPVLDIGFDIDPVEGSPC
jgi:nicotinate-nucleotide pyrophosphorylase (carboxylating)